MLDRLDARLVRDTATDFRRTWPQLAITDLLARALGFVLLVPATGLLLKLFLLTADDGVLTDTDIAVFVLHPIGLTAALVVGAVTVGTIFAESGMLMVIGFGAAEGRRATWLDALRYIAAHGRDLVKLATRFLVTIVAIAAPFLGGIALVYRHFLGAHDINFYLANRPPEFRNALLVVAVLLALLAVIVLRLVAGWLFAVPLVLFEGQDGWRAMGASARITAGRQWTIAGTVMAWILAVALLGWIVTFGLGLIARLAVPAVGGSLALFAVGLTATLLVAGLANLVLLFLSTSLFPLLLVRLYRTVSRAGRFDPVIVDRGTPGSGAPISVPGKWLLAGVAATVGVVVVGGYFASLSLGAQEDAIVIAHRGAAGAAPENTMAAFERAIADGADWIELDVQEDADGTVIVAHDSDFMKIANAGLKVWEATADDLRDLDIGSWFDPAFADQRVATLEEVLALAKDKIGVVIELKYYGHDRRLEPAVVEIVETAGMVDQVMVMSLKRAGLQKIRKLRPDWTAGLLNTVSVGDLTRLDVDFLALNATAARAATIRRAHKRGMRVFVWTIDDPVQMSVMMSRGVDGIITDEPARARKVIEYRDDLGPFGRLVVWIAGETGFLRITDESSTAEDA